MRVQQSDRQSAPSVSGMYTQVYTRAQLVSTLVRVWVCFLLLFTAHGSIGGPELSVSTVCQTCLKLRPVSLTSETSLLPLPHHQHHPWLSVTLSFLSHTLHPSLHLSIL